MSGKIGFSVGARLEKPIVFPDSTEDSFIQLSGDENPLHTQDAFAIKYGFKSRLVHGLLATSICLPLIGELLGTPGFVCLTQTIKFHKPIYLGESVTASVEITHATEALGIVVVGFSLIDQNETRLLSGEVQTRVLI